MIDLDLYRARIGQFDRKIRSGNYKNSFKYGDGKIPNLWMFLLALSIGTVCLPLFYSVGVFCSSSVSSIHNTYLNLRNSATYNIHNSPSLKASVQPSHSKLLARGWNSFMKATNGNKTCINVAHWNGGSSHLGKSSKGKEKLQHVKYLLNKHNVDVLGLSEANLHRSVN